MLACRLAGIQICKSASLQVFYLFVKVFLKAYKCKYAFIVLWFYGFSGNFAILFQANVEEIIEPAQVPIKICFQRNRKTEKRKRKQ